MTDNFHPAGLAPEWKRIVVKVGTSVLTGEDRQRVSRARVEAVASQVGELWRQKRQVVLVTSGAVGVGMGILKLKKRPRVLANLQAAAATGQGLLMQWYTARFEQEGFHAAQVLLTRGDLEDRRRYLNVKATLERLMMSSIVPIINENDTVSVEELCYGDNDLLSAHLATLIGAQLLVILSDVDELIGPQGEPLSHVTEITPELERSAKGTSQSVSTGGMRTKLQAARISMQSGFPMVVANGRAPHRLIDLILKKEDQGTWFFPGSKAGVKDKHRWLAFTGKPKGTILVDAGARDALERRGSSLLASGVCGVEGDFRQGDLVSVAQVTDSMKFARGLAMYSSEDLRAIRGKKSEEIPGLLGAWRKGHEVIHRDWLVLLKG